MAINYTKIGWDTSKYVNPTNMKHMDDGIKAACDGVDAIGTNYIKASDSALQTIANTATGANAAISLKSNNVRSVADYRDQNGTALGMMGFDNNKKPVIYDVPANAWKEIALADNVVKLSSTGTQTIATGVSIPLSVKRNEANFVPYIEFANNGGRLGLIGVNTSNKPVFFDTTDHEIALVDTMVKTETYTGTTDASGQLVTNLLYRTGMLNVEDGAGSAHFCFARRSGSNKLVVEIRLANTLALITNTQITITVAYIG